MRGSIAGMYVVVAFLAACGAEQKTEDGIAFQRSTDAPLAGKTLQCSAQGPSSAITFSKDGRISGTFLNTNATGDWFALKDGSVEVHVDAGPVSIRDILRRSGSRWAGRNINCS